MGQLLTGDIRSLFNGVSRQPDVVRLPAQVEECDNAILSVVDGGPKPRPSLRHVDALSGLSTGTNYFLHPIDRDPTQRYVLVLGDEVIKVYDTATGASQTVSTPDGVSYLNCTDPLSEFAAVSIADYTFIVNRNTTTALKVDPSWTAVAGGTGTNIGDMTASGGLAAAFDGVGGTVAREAASTDANIGKDYGAGTEKMITRVVASGIVGGTSVQLQWSSDNVTYNTVQTATPSGGAVDMWNFESPGKYRYWRLKFTAGAPVNIDVDAITFYESATIFGVEDKFSDLALPSTLNRIYKITGDASALDDYYVIGKADGSYEETVNPASRSYFDETTMPHILVRNADGTWTFSKATWSPRRVGNETLVPPPNFLGRKIRDVFLHKNRLAVLGDEYAITTQAGDYFTFWPDKATEVLDSDPIDVAASTSKVTILDWGVPFRSSVFLSAENAQFELSSGDRTLTPTTAALDLTTSYTASKKCRPIVMGDSLFFASTNGTDSQVFEYFYDDRTISNTAADVTKHCEGYVPSEILQFAADPVSNTLFALTSGDPDAIYLYNIYWNNEEKAQSAWHRWVFSGATIRGITVLDKTLYIVADRGDAVYLEKVRCYHPEEDATLTFDVGLDRRQTLTGVYDAGNDWTTWTVDYVHANNLRVILSGSWAAGNQGRELTGLTFPTTSTVRKTGNWSANTAYVGIPRTVLVTLSKLYPRGPENQSMFTGRLQLRRIKFSYRDTSYFEVDVTPRNRTAKTYVFNARTLGEADNVIGEVALVSRGTFSVPVWTRGDTGTISITSDSPLPFTIVSASWVGFYNDTGRSGS